MRDREGSATAVLVLGARGHIGQAVVREFLAHGYRVTALTRKGDVPALTAIGAHVVRGDAEGRAGLATWLPGHGVVVDAAAPHPLGLLAAPGPEAMDPIGHAHRRMRPILSAVARAGARFVFVSSFTTLARPLTGSAEAAGARLRRAIHPYFRIKEAMERLVLDEARRGLRAVVVNPVAVLGPWEERDQASSLTRLILARRLPFVMQHRVNVIDVRDVAANLRAAVEAGLYGEPIPLVGHDVPITELTARIAALASVPPPRPGVGPGLASAMAFWAEVVFAMAGRPAPPALQAVPLVADFRPMAPGGAQRRLGIGLRSLDRTLRDTVAWHTGRFEP